MTIFNARVPRRISCAKPIPESKWPKLRQTALGSAAVQSDLGEPGLASEHPRQHARSRYLERFLRDSSLLGECCGALYSNDMLPPRQWARSLRRPIAPMLHGS